jgi:hypothetical protein
VNGWELDLDFDGAVAQLEAGHAILTISFDHSELAADQKSKIGCEG